MDKQSLLARDNRLSPRIFQHPLAPYPMPRRPVPATRAWRRYIPQDDCPRLLRRRLEGIDRDDHCGYGQRAPIKPILVHAAISKVDA